MAKRPKTLKEWKNYKTTFYPPPVPANRTYIPFKDGLVPPGPSDATPAPDSGQVGINKQKLLLAYNDSENSFPLGLPDQKELVAQGGGEPPLGWSRQLVQNGTFLPINIGDGITYANDFQDYHKDYSTYEVPPVTGGEVNTTQFLDYIAPIPSWNSTVRNTWMSYESRVRNWKDPGTGAIGHEVRIYMYNIDYPNGVLVFEEVLGGSYYTEEYNYYYFPSPNIVGKWHYKKIRNGNIAEQVDINVRELATFDFAPNPEILYTDSHDGSVINALIYGNAGDPGSLWKPGNPHWTLKISSATDPNNTPIRTLSGDITNDPVTGQQSLPLKNTDGSPVFWDGKNEQGQYVPEGTYKYTLKVTCDQLKNGSEEAYGGGINFAFVEKKAPDVITGKYSRSFPDLSWDSRILPVVISRTYNISEHNKAPYYGWKFNFDTSTNEVQETSTRTSAYVQRPSTRDKFVNEGAGYVPATQDLNSTLTKNGNNILTLTTKDQVKYEYDGNNKNRLKKIYEPNGNTITFTYETPPGGEARVSQITDTCGRIFNVTYDSNNKIIAIADPSGRAINYEYDQNGNLSAAVYPLGYRIQYQYDQDRRLIGITDRRGFTTANTFDSLDRQTSETNAKSVVTTFTYSTNPNKSVITRNGRSTTLYYNDSGDVIQAQDALGHSNFSEYDSRRNLTKSIDAKGNATNFTYDSKNNLTSATDTLNNTVSIAYEPNFNRPSQITTPLGQVTQFFYDGNGNLTRTHDALGYDTLYYYDSYGQVTRTVDARGYGTDFAYDTLGRLISTTDALNHTTTFSYDGRGNILTKTDALSNVTSWSYDVLDRLLSVTDAQQHTASVSYDENSNVLRVTDPLLRITRYNYDPLNLLTTVTDAKNQQTQYSYDLENNLVSITDARGGVTTFTYDLDNRKISEADPIGRDVQYSYDENHQLITRTTGGNHAPINYSYDVLGRLIQKTYPDQTSVSYTYDAISRRTAMTDTIGTYTYQYDSLNRLTSTTAPGNKTISYQYDPNGNLLTLTEPEGTQASYSYDAIGRLISASRVGKSANYVYDAVNNLTSVTNSNGTIGNFTYDNLHRLTQVNYLSSGNPIFSAAYQFDPMGNRTRKTVTRPNRTWNEDYSYDALDQLVQVLRPQGESIFAYDASGNLTSENISGRGTINYSYNPANELTNITYPDLPQMNLSYDFNGNLYQKTQDTSTTTYYWDFEDRLTRVHHPDNQESLFNYNGDGLRVRRSPKNGPPVNYLWSGSEVLKEYSDQGGPPPVSYFYGAGEICQEQGGTYRFPHHDGLGSAVTLT
ncbi:MAG: hypothetical protein M1536_00630, partial [Firmicutes bacterium]|nr:hypothetical protein [Bacillota bacterium]